MMEYGDSSVYFPFTFTQQDIDNVLFGYIRTPEETSNGFALSGVYVNSPANEIHWNPWIANIAQVHQEPTVGHPIPYMELFHDELCMQNLPEDIKIVETLLSTGRHRGVFTGQRRIAKGTRFGPYTGNIVLPPELRPLEKNSVWEIFQDGELTHYVDGAGDQRNWMKYVNCARHDGEQNLVLVQDEGELFYEVSKDIAEGSELLVWYGDTYLKYMGIPITMKTKLAKIETDGGLGGDSFACDRCGKSIRLRVLQRQAFEVHAAFTASSILRTHIRQHSGEKPFKCRHCGKAFASHAAHDSHVRRTHTKEKPCICEFCGKAFAQSYELKFHMNMHTGEKPYTCEKCGRGFSSPSSRDRHRSNFDCTTRKNRGAEDDAKGSEGTEGDLNGEGFTAEEEQVK
ncbi:PR domain zinc finger protein 14 [Desmophyllum pertusum]|uniref:PR domain zinc finger protein 14 n=1 Tax=Desmophyllum pertusum TaxID=174260 RepID=A0A9W9YAR3_9CNID|nr:PR domain zinc finger protein 14 [Desmophyllum pertusum]